MAINKIESKSSAMVCGILIFFVPFFTYLSPQNLKQLSNSNLFEILLSLILILIVIWLCSLSIETLITRVFKKKIILFHLFCFAFYLNFLFTPFLDFTQELLYPKFGFIKGSLIFIYFELTCLFIIVLGARFFNFSIRMLFILSILMLINAFIPLTGYLIENIGKKSSIQYEIKNNIYTLDEVQIKRNVYYIILDEMIDIKSADEMNIISKNKTLDSLSKTGLRYINKSKSSYSTTYLTLASILLLDHHQTPSSPKYLDSISFYPFMMGKTDNALPLISYLNKANSSFLWSGNSWASCVQSKNWSCVNAGNNFSSKSSFKFYVTTPFLKIYQIFSRYNETQDSVNKFLNYINKNGIPEKPFFAFIHHLSPHSPYLVTQDCVPTNKFLINQNFDGYKASYKCVLETIQIFMEKINNIDPDAIVIFQGDHGYGLTDTTEKEKQLRGKIFNSIKAPDFCFEKYGLPRTNVNTVRFALNCAYGFKLPSREYIHYGSYYEDNPNYGSVVERKIYE
mgnify:CR=1 FL=1|tara:strand:+ start:1334 stop:2863 length:1530 start_codon:yes stop_codon:yes gene_type:complete